MVIDITPIYSFLQLPSDQMIFKTLILFGWIPIALAFLWGAKEVWLFSRQTKWGSTIKFVLLAIDIPRGNELSPKAVENLFTYIAGAHEPPDLIEKYWVGMYQLSFSFEIVSINGYTQFLIRTPTIYRNLVESAVYSQYPDAEITEVDDYTEGSPSKFPDDEYDIWGGEMIQAKNEVYPIKTYTQFEHQLGAPETHFKDPMATLMDLYSSLREGEQFWLQMIIVPMGFDWPEKGEKEISKIIGEKVKSSKGIADLIVDLPLSLLETLGDVFLSLGGETSAKKEEKENDSFKMMNLKPKQKKQIEAIQEKISKLGFETKIRFVYLARREVINKPKAISGFIGYMKQFMDLDLNNLKPDMDVTATTAHYFFIDSRKNEKKRRVISAYKDRSGTRGRKRFVMNIEELATLWHFPIEAVVKAPLIQKSPGRKSEPPMSLPFTEEIRSDFPKLSKLAEEENIFKESGNNNVMDKKISYQEESFFEEEKAEKGSPPENLPFA